MFKLLKKARQLLKEEAKLKKDIRRIEKSTLDYDALTNIVNTVSNFGVEIHIETVDGIRMDIRTANSNGIAYQSFADRYKKQHNG